jgi:Pectate lyase superfamily protein
MLRTLLMAICPLLFAVSSVGQNFVNVRNFGAKGDGKSEDGPSINLAIRTARLQSKNVYFPAGTYLCNTVDKMGHILNFEADAVHGITLYGDGNTTKVTTSSNEGSTLLYIWAYAKNDGVTVKNMFFESTHPLINKPTQGVFFQGTRGENFTNVTVSGCRFEGFGNSLGGQGIKGLVISKNNFGAPRGHDNAKNDNEPAVFIWLYDNSNGYCSNISITDNNADGYTGSGPINALTTKRAMDGFVYGTGYGFTITGNTTRDFSEEHYALAPKASFPGDTSRVLINNNQLDASIPAGSMDDNGKKHVSNYGIRCDISNAEISGNEIRNYTYGILVRGVEYPNARLHTYQISGNKLYAAGDTANYDVQSAILIQGNVNIPANDIQVTGNEIHINALKNFVVSDGIVLYDMTKGVVQENTLISDQRYTSTQPIAISYGRVSGVQERANRVVGMKFRKMLSKTDSVQIITDGSSTKGKLH